MVLTYTLLFLFDIVILALVVRVFMEKRKIRKDEVRLLDSETSVAELTKSMEHLISEYKRVASNIQEDISTKRDELLKTVQRADRLLMELVRRSDKFELAFDGSDSLEPPAGRTASQVNRPQPKQREPEPVTDAPQPNDVSAYPDEKKELQANSQEPARRSESRPCERKPAHLDLAKSDMGEIKRTYTSGLPKEKAPQRTRPFVTPTAENEEPAENDGEMLRTKKLVLDLSRQGLDTETIARSLRIPVSQVNLILDVQKSKAGAR
ncbi:MAG: hypothetical protein JW941_11165 [Candidatus Coatesbacteria bacterium]|nr:hypothetical protein [Candidatus Coatesbacteria bacterium]